jgi:anti-sigma regulatory factor (Ser/Thr protein kinase)
VPTDTQEIDTLKAKLEATNKELEIYSSNITDIQLALTEIYERKDLK